MSENNTAEKRSAFLKPTLETPFHIDMEWLKTNEHNWRITISSYLCEEHKAFFTDNDPDILIDSVDPDTGEVTQTDRLLDILMTHCAREEKFIPENGPLTDCVFRVFLSNENKPLNVREISQMINRPPETILKTLSSGRTYRGIKPV